MSSTFNKLRVLGASAAIAAGFAMNPAAAQLAVSNTGTGNAVVIPYYTVNGGWETLVNLTNTTDNSLAVKFRMHEGANSRDVLDFNIALSPRDVWTATIGRDSNGRPRLVTQDRSCTSPISVRDSGVTASEVAYVNGPNYNFSDYTVTEVMGTEAAKNRLSEGYIVILTMGEDDRVANTNAVTQGDNSVTVTAADSQVIGASVTHVGYGTTNNARVAGSTAYNAKHVNGEPRNCVQVDTDFQPRVNGGQPMALEDLDGQNPILGEAGSGNPDARARTDNVIGYGRVVSRNALKVNATLVNQPRGTSAGLPALNVQNYGNGQNLVTAQEFPWFLEPTLAGTNGLWTTGGLVALENGIRTSTIANVWTSVPGNGAQGEWVVNFPTKRFRVDFDRITNATTDAVSNLQAACNEYRNALVTISGEPELLANKDECVDNTAGPFGKAFQAQNTGSSPVVATYSIWDREENKATLLTPGGTRPSPAPPGESAVPTALDFETNVLRVGRNVDQLDGVLNSVRTRLIDVGTQGLPGTAAAGWMQLNFTNGAVPANGFLITQRNFGDRTLSFANAAEHAYTRN